MPNIPFDAEICLCCGFVSLPPEKPRQTCCLERRTVTLGQIKHSQNAVPFYNPRLTKEITKSGRKALAKILPARSCQNCARDQNEDNCGMSYRQECVALSTWIPKKG